MRITSKATYILPFLLLLLAALFVSFRILNYSPEFLPYYFDTILGFRLAILTIGLTVGFYFALRIMILRLNARLVRVIALLVPSAFQFIYFFIVFQKFPFTIGYLLEGLLLLWASKLLSNRYTATVTNSEIQLVNLIGQRMSVPLNEVIGLEQKRHILSIFKEFGFLNIARKTCITYRDDQMDEYEVTIFTRAFNADKMFRHIIERAYQCGNNNIRQYS